MTTDARVTSPLRVVLPALVALFFLMLPFIITNPAYIQIAIMVLLYAYLTASWNLVGGFAGVLPLGHTLFAGLGAYTSTILFMEFNLSPWLGMLAGGVVAMIAGILVGLPTLRLRGAYFALATMAFLEGGRVILENTHTIFGLKINGPQGILLKLVGDSPAYYQSNNKAFYYYIILVLTAIILFITYKVATSRLGYYLTSGGEDKEAAEALGVNVARCKLYAMILSTFFMALGGTFYAQMVRYINPRGLMNLEFSFEIAFIAIVGGRGTVAGPILGSLLLVPLAGITRLFLSNTSFSGIHLAVYGLVLMLVMIFQPRGITEPLSRFYNGLILRLEGRK